MNTDRNLLFGVMALQMDFITREQLVVAMNAWVLEKQTPLGQVLLKQKALTPELHTLLESVVAQHLKKHGDDAERSLQAIASAKPVNEELGKIGDVDVTASLLNLASIPTTDDLYATQVTTVTIAQGASVGAATSSGQRFRILRPHAKGGLGEVFVAKDEELRREVALKHMQSHHADNIDSRSRFMLEAEITGGLEHPGIVPVYGLGTYADGRPYYAMRFIRGDSLKDAIDKYHRDQHRNAGDRALELRKLLGRLIDVCNAIEYAHSRGVVHRDLKPGNVMLGKYGETLVVDWGLAKAAGQADASMGHNKISEEGSLTLSRISESAPTQMGSAIGTPQYMSPEQAAGRLDVIGPQSDVYSLGATLYCLLAGEPPLSRDARDLGELLRRVQSGDIRPPRTIKPDIPKALEAVCLKAMAVDLDKRYPSPKALADDLEHWLANEPVSARRETFAERAARWARRHRTWIQAGVSAIVVITIVAVAFSFLLYKERNRAEESFLQARATVDQFFTDISENRLLDVPGLQPLREELLKSALAYYEDFAQQRADDRSVRAELGKTHYRIGLIVGRIGSKPKSLESLSEAQAIQEEVIEEGSAPAEAYADLANTHNAIGDLQLQMGNDREALSRFESALDLREEIVTDHPDDDQLRRKLANSHNNVAVTLARLQDTAKAEANYAQANKIREQLASEHPGNAQFKTDLARGHYNFGLYKRDRNEMDAALESFRRAAEAYEHVAKLETSKIEPRRELAIVHRVIGDVQADLTKFELAAASYNKARDLAEALARRNPFLVELRADVAAILSNIGHLNRKRDRTDDALRAFEQAEAILQGLVEDDSTVTRYQKDLADTRVQVGIVLLNQDKLAPARAQFDAGLNTYQILAKNNPQDRSLQVAIAQAHVNIGLIHRSHADHETALATFRESVKIYEKLLLNSPGIDAEAGLADAILNVAVELRGLSRIEDALIELERARSVQTKLVQAHPDVIKYRHVETEIDYLIGLLRFERAQQGVESSDADVKLRAREELNAALAMYRRVRDQRVRLVKELPGNLYYENLLGVALDELAVVLAAHGENEEALAMSQEATPYLQRVVSNAPEQIEYLGNLRAHYRKRAHFERAAGNFDKAAEMSIEHRKTSSQNAEALYYAAVDLVATASAANNSTDIPKTQSALWLDQAVETLEEAVKAGEDVAKLKDDPNLAPLRDHARFKALFK